MITIYKYELKITDEQFLELPENSKIISANFIGEKLYIWAIVNTLVKKENVKFTIVSTGQPNINIDYCVFIDTAIGFGGKLVLHIFLNPNI